MEEKVERLEQKILELQNNNLIILQLKQQLEKIKQDDGKNNYRPSIHIPLPKPIDIKTGNIKQNMKFFKDQWSNYLVASSIKYASEEEKISILLSAIGEDCLKIYLNLKLFDEEKKNSEIVLQKIEENIIPKINKRYERAIFNTTYQKENESIDQYINRLRELIKNCQYKEMEDELLLDRIVVSIKNIKLRQRLWEEEKTTLQEAINICRINEQTEIQMKKLENPEEINKIKTSNNNNKNNNYNKNSNSNKTNNAYNNKGDNRMIENCHRCGNTHKIKQCPAWRHICKKCGIHNHFESKCRKTNVKIDVINTTEEENIL